MGTHTLRLGPGEVRESLLDFVRERGIQAVCGVSDVGSFTEARLRLANACREDPNPIIDLPRPEDDTRDEVLSLSGMVGAGGSHLHMILNDEGNVVGGHVVGNLKVFTKCELVLLECAGLVFKREFDARTSRS